MTESRVRELAPLVTRCATELSSLWPVRPKPFVPGRAPVQRGRAARERESTAKSVAKPA
jgi:hypothetical protein